jgi:glucose-6-phosphate-specific signal transduction histidine kinase
MRIGSSSKREAERRAEQERMPIARELHDLVAHTLTEINIQAAASAEVTATGPARAAPEGVEQTSHRAIGELRAILGILRDPDHSELPRAPAPSIKDLPELTAGMRTSGLPAELEITGQLPSGCPKPARWPPTGSCRSL